MSGELTLMTDDEMTLRLSKRQAESSDLLKFTLESLRHEIQQIAKGLTDFKEALERESAAIRDEMRRGFAETQAMIKFPHV